MIDGRTIAKYEISDRLYCDEIFILSLTVVELAKMLAYNIIYLIIAFSLSGLDFSYFGVVYGWQIFTLLTLQSYFQMVAAAGKTMEDAQAKAMPLLFFFILFNGFFVTKATVVVWMEWALYISPLFYFVQQVSVELFSDGTDKDDPDYLKSGQYVVDYYDFQNMKGLAIIVLGLELVAFRVLQIVFLKRLNNPQR